MRPLPKKSAAVLAAAVSSLALAVSDAPHAQAACLPSNPSSTCLTFDPSSASTLANRTGFFGEFTPDVVIDPDNRYNRARVQFKFTGSWTTPFTLSGIATPAMASPALCPLDRRLSLHPQPTSTTTPLPG